MTEITPRQVPPPGAEEATQAIYEATRYKPDADRSTHTAQRLALLALDAAAPLIRQDERDRLRPLLRLLVKTAGWVGYDLADLLEESGCPELLDDLIAGS